MSSSVNLRFKPPLAGNDRLKYRIARARRQKQQHTGIGCNNGVSSWYGPYTFPLPWTQMGMSGLGGTTSPQGLSEAQGALSTILSQAQSEINQNAAPLTAEQFTNYSNAAQGELTVIVNGGTLSASDSASLFSQFTIALHEMNQSFVSQPAPGVSLTPAPVATPAPAPTSVFDQTLFGIPYWEIGIGVGALLLLYYFSKKR